MWNPEPGTRRSEIGGGIDDIGLMILFVILTVVQFLEWRDDPEENGFLVLNWAMTNAVYLPLAIWCLWWSRLAIMLLFGWHLFCYWQFTF